MSDDTKQTTPVDLFGGNEESDSAADAGTNGEKSSDLLASNKAPLETSKEDKAAKAAEQRKKQVEHWVEEISAGKKSLNDLPADKQWLKPGIESGLNLIAKEPEIDKIVEEKLLKKEAEHAFKSTLQTLTSMSLSKAQRETLNEEFNDLKAEGLSDLKALTKAMKVAGISADREDQERLIARQRMALPMQGTNRINDTVARPDDPDFHKRVTDPKEKMKILMQHMRG